MVLHSGCEEMLKLKKHTHSELHSLFLVFKITVFKP